MRPLATVAIALLCGCGSPRIVYGDECSPMICVAQVDAGCVQSDPICCRGPGTPQCGRIYVDGAEVLFELSELPAASCTPVESIHGCL